MRQWSWYVQKTLDYYPETAFVDPFLAVAAVDLVHHLVAVPWLVQPAVSVPTLLESQPAVVPLPQPRPDAPCYSLMGLATFETTEAVHEDQTAVEIETDSAAAVGSTFLVASDAGPPAAFAELLGTVGHPALS